MASEENKEFLDYTGLSRFKSNLDGGLSAVLSAVGDAEGEILEAVAEIVARTDTRLVDKLHGRPYDVTAEDLAGLTSLPSNMFWNDEWLRSIEYPAGFTAVGQECTGATSLEAVVLPDGIETINGFQGATGLAEINFPPSLRTITAYSLNQCALASLVFNDGLLTIGSGCFGSLPNLTLVDIPATVTSVAGAFTGSTYYQGPAAGSVTVVMRPASPPDFGAGTSKAFLVGSKASSIIGTLYAPDASVQAYADYLAGLGSAYSSVAVRPLSEYAG